MKRRHLLLKLKRLLPATLFGRALLILVLPVVLVQLVAIYMFYERHWDSVVRNMSSALAGEIRVLVSEFESPPAKDRIKRVAEMGDEMGIGAWYDTRKASVFVEGKGREEYPEFFSLLSRKLSQPFMVRRVGPDQDIQISILMEEGTLELRTSKKRLVSSTTYIFILWMAGSATLLSMIAIMFLRNQIRPMRQLAQAAERFGLGQDVPFFSPRGALEVRQAGKAFLEMRDRILRQVSSRTEMLAGISHDLRTPITRIKLQLALMKPDAKAHQAIEADLEEMEHMIHAYLAFAKGEGEERSESVVMDDYVQEIAHGYIRHQQPVSCQPMPDVWLSIRPKAMRRAIQNLIDNALRYGRKADISAQDSPDYWVLHIRDEGSGIPEDLHESVFRPFTRLDPSRNTKTGGAGLGLSIARDIVLAHGGTVRLINLPEGGLCAEIRLPKNLSV